MTHSAPHVHGSGRARLAGAALALLVAAAAGSACGTASARAMPKPEQANLNFTVKDMTGREVRLADFKGRPMLINFWATWCTPCKAEIPAFIELSETYKSKNLVILGISVDDKAEDLRKYAAEHRMNYPVLMGLDRDDLLDAFDAQYGVPITWFIRADGTVSNRKQGTESKAWFDAQIKALF
jgi:cytochrome c biogenesis protein CcmG/thiol:disulfide interchange protein DsbE